jgi:adenine-specific DNA-methyltransferase
LSRLNDLIRQVGRKDEALAADLQREVAALADRRSFGLNFERHVPEAVELPGRPVRRGDKVRVLPPRGEMPKKADEKLWRVASIDRGSNGRVARLESLRDDEEETSVVALADLIVVAEFRDPIYPGLVSTGNVARGGDKPFHTVINAENYHALQALLFTHRGKVDCIYIDPPYNSGARDWKYNNDYVEEEDLYRHSKWLAFMERRLVLAKDLLNPDESVLIVTIDEKEYLRLGLLLEQTFPSGKMQMISSVTNPKGTGRGDDFARTNEFIYIVRFGRTRPPRAVIESLAGSEVGWETTRRRNLASVRGRKGKGACGPNQFYPIFVNTNSDAIVGRGTPLEPHVDRTSVAPPDGTVAVFPVRPDGTEMNWEFIPETFDRLWQDGFIRANGSRSSQPQAYVIQHLPNKARKEIDTGVATIEGKRQDGSVIARYMSASTKTATTQWNFTSHSAEHGGTGVLKALIPGRRFDYPKSLYAVEDVLRFFVGDKPRATVVDFFSGSGTTAHAVMRLNREDDGHRQSISVTNNEVSEAEQARLRAKQSRPGDPEWESLGICDSITKPRLQAAVTGITSNGEPVKGDYRFADQFPMSEGFEENVEFFTLTYEAPLRVSSNREFKRIAPLLWLRAGSRGRRIEDVRQGWDVADAYGVLADLDHVDKFLAALDDQPDATLAFIVTDEDRLFESVVRDLPDHVQPVRLYEAYLRNFEIESGRGTL